MNKLLLIAIEAAILGGAEIMKIYSGEFDVILKTDNSPLTKADKNANTVITSLLEKTEFPIISEENEEIPYNVREQ